MKKVSEQVAGNTKNPNVAGCYCTSLPKHNRCDFCQGYRRYDLEVLRIMADRFQHTKEAEESHVKFAVDGVVHRAILELINASK